MLPGCVNSQPRQNVQLISFSYLIYDDRSVKGPERLESNDITHSSNHKGKIKTAEESWDYVSYTSSNCRFHFFHQKRVRAASCLDSKATQNKHIECVLFAFIPGSEEDFRLHPGAEREDLCSQRSAAHRPHRERHASRILSGPQNCREIKEKRFQTFWTKLGNVHVCIMGNISSLGRMLPR